MKILNLLEACSIVGDALASRMALTSKRGTMSKLMPFLKDCLILLRARLPCLRITRVIFCTLPVIPSIKLGEFTLGSLTLALIMYKGEKSSSRQSTRAKLPKKKTPIASNDSNISFKTLDASYVLTNKSGKVVAKCVGGKHKGSKTCVWVPKVLVSNVKGPKTIWVPKIKN
jgi:flagellar biosynthesis component FlhA